MPCSVNTALDVSMAIRLYWVMYGSGFGWLTTPNSGTRCRGAVHPHKPGHDGYRRHGDLPTHWGLSTAGVQFHPPCPGPISSAPKRGRNQTHEHDHREPA